MASRQPAKFFKYRVTAVSPNFSCNRYLAPVKVGAAMKPDVQPLLSERRFMANGRRTSDFRKAQQRGEGRNKDKSMTPLQNWVERASTAQLRRLARLARTTVGTLRQMAGRYRKSNTTAELAIRIDHAAAILRSRDPTLPEIPRESLSAACRGCEFAKRCRKA